MLSQLKIAYKVYLMGAIQLSLIVLVSWIGISQMAKIGEEITEITVDDIPLSNSLTLLTEHKLKQAILFERAMLEGALIKLAFPGAEEKLAKVIKEFKKITKTVEHEIKDVEVFIEEAIPHLHTEAAVTEYKKLLEAMLAIEKEYLQLENEALAVVAMIEQGNIEPALEQALIVEKHIDVVDQHIQDTLNEVQAFTLAAAQQAKHDEELGIKKIIVTVAISIVLALLIPFIIGRSVTKPVNQLTERLREVAHGDGDLTLRLDDSAKDETGEAARSFNQFMEKLSGTIKHVSQSAEKLGKSSEQAILVMEKTLSNVENQRDETMMVSNAMEEMRTATEHVAQNTSEAAKVAESARTRVSDGKLAAVDTQDIIKQLANEMTNASSVIQALASETDNIGNVLEAIRGIAEQTNLLALNAAIEAARAGDTGRGFAVVADEVRSLAQRTQSSTGDIQNLVESLQAEAKNAVESMEKGSISTERCLEKSSETANALEDASQAVNSISDLNTQIASTAEEQSAAAEQIKQSVANITEIANEASKGTAETASANQTIAKGVIDLHTTLNQFQV